MKILIILFLFCQLSFSVNCEKHPIYCHIKQLKPNMNYRKAMDLSNLIYKYSKKYGQDPHLSVAIAAQETGIKEINRAQTIIVFFNICDEVGCKEHYKYVTGYSDLSMFQFHAETIRYYNINPILLKNNLEYCVNWHFKLIKKKRKICKDLGEDAWTCYHSRSPKLRKFYKELVIQYYNH